MEKHDFCVLKRVTNVPMNLYQRSLWISRAACVLAALFPLAAAVGWIFGIPLLTHGIASLPAMQPNTIVGLLLGCVVIGSNPPKSVRLILATLIVLLGALTLAEYLFAKDLGIDHFLVHGLSTTAGRFPGRSSPQTSANFLLLGLAFWCYLGRSSLIRAGQAFALLACANAIIAFTGYIFSTSQFYGFPTFAPATGMAIHTSISFTMLSIALFCSRPCEGMMTLMTSESRSGTMARRILLTSFFTPPVLGVLTRGGVEA
ncbi:MAG: hypothetical protein ACXWP5_13130, partial [Bdellovibrionota bacterium]